MRVTGTMPAWMSSSFVLRTQVRAISLATIDKVCRSLSFMAPASRARIVRRGRLLEKGGRGDVAEEGLAVLHRAAMHPLLPGPTGIEGGASPLRHREVRAEGGSACRGRVAGPCREVDASLNRTGPLPIASGAGRAIRRTIRGCVRERTRYFVQCGCRSGRVACSQAERFDPHGR